MNELQDFTASPSIPWILVLTSLLIRPLLAKGLRKLGKTLHSKSIEEVSTGVSWFIVPLVVNFVSQLSSVPKTWAIAMSSGAYLVSVLILMGALRKLILSSMGWATRHLTGNRSMAAGFVPLIQNLVTLFIVLLATILILQHFGYDVWSLITALGVSSLAVGLAAKDTLSHMISGFVLIIDRNLKPGDQISFTGVTGLVQEIGLRSTKLLTPAGNTWIVPNSELVNTKILNFSVPNQGVKVTTTIKVSLDTSLDQVRQIGASVLSSLGKIVAAPKIEVFLRSISEGNQAFDLSFWVGSDSPEIQSEALSRFLEEFVKRATSENIEFVGAPAAIN